MQIRKEMIFIWIKTARSQFLGFHLRLKKTTFAKVMKRLFYLFWITLGAFAMAVGINYFLAPHQIATGGTAGMAQVLEYIYPLSIGTWMILVNIPLMLVGFKYLGTKFIFRTIIAILMISLFLWILPYILDFKTFSNALILNTLYGGVFIGLGIGFIFKGGASAGGGSILAKILSQKKGVKSSQVLFLIDALVIVSIAWVNHNIELGLWSMIGIFIASKVMEKVLSGNQNQKVIHLSSDQNLEEFGCLLEKELGIQGTYVKGQRLNHQEQKDILFLTVDNSKIFLVKEMILQEGLNVRMMILEAGEIMSPTVS